MIRPGRLWNAALLFGIAGVAEDDEEASLPAVLALAQHDGLKRAMSGWPPAVGQTPSK